MTDKQTGARAAAEEINTQYAAWRQEYKRGDYTPLAAKVNIIEAIIRRHCPQDKAVELPERVIPIVDGEEYHCEDCGCGMFVQVAPFNRVTNLTNNIEDEYVYQCTSCGLVSTPSRYFQQNPKHSQDKAVGILVEALKKIKKRQFREMFWPSAPSKDGAQGFTLGAEKATMKCVEIAGTALADHERAQQ